MNRLGFPRNPLNWPAAEAPDDRSWQGRLSALHRAGNHPMTCLVETWPIRRAGCAALKVRRCERLWPVWTKEIERRGRPSGIGWQSCPGNHVCFCRRWPPSAKLEPKRGAANASVRFLTGPRYERGLLTYDSRSQSRQASAGEVAASILGKKSARASSQGPPADAWRDRTHHAVTLVLKTPPRANHQRIVRNHSWNRCH